MKLKKNFSTVISCGYGIVKYSGIWFSCISYGK